VSVFTVVAEDDLAYWLESCGAGRLLESRGVEGGVENTNYHVRTDRGEFVVTLFERMSDAAAARSLAVTAALHDDGLPVARPWRQQDGWLATLEGKPAALCSWLPGAHPDVPTAAQCAAIGGFLARMHVCPSQQQVVCGADPRGPDWRQKTLDALAPRLDASLLALAGRAMTSSVEPIDVPTGLVHADLFRDNALFDGDRLCGVVDFHYACHGAFIYDIAVAVLDWCFDGDRVDGDRLQTLCRAYTAVRVPTAVERAHFPSSLARAALRFWLSRAYDESHPRAGQAVTVKDSSEMARRLDSVLSDPPEWP
jgi:homoserine kinase type II